MSAPPVCSMLVVSALLMTVAAAYTPPPANGDWSISDVTSISNQVITLNGNLYVLASGRLELNNSTLKMNCALDGQYIIEVKPGGELVLDRTTVTCTNTSLHYKFQIHGKATVKNSVIEEVWGSTNVYSWQDAGICINSNETTFDGTTVRFCPQTGITIFNSSPSISNCDINNNSVRGIHCYGTASPTISANTVHRNGMVGIYLREQSRGSVSNNTVHNHTRIGINVINQASPAVFGNTIHDIMDPQVTAGISTWGEYGSNPAVRNNTIWNCKIGISTDVNSTANISGNRISRCTMYGIGMTGNATPTVLRNRIFDNCWEGIYSEQKSAGNIIENTITSTSGYGIVTLDSAMPNITGNCLSGCLMAGIICSDSSNVTISGNTVNGSWYGIYSNGLPTVRIHSNAVANCSVSGVWNNERSQVSVEHTTIERSQFGIYNNNSREVKINNNIIVSNKFGIWNNGSGFCDIDNNNISRNYQAGIYSSNNAHVMIRNNNVVFNEYVGINNTFDSNTTIKNNLIANVHYGIAVLDSSKAFIGNNTITGHYEDGVLVSDTAEATISDRNDISGNRRAGVRCAIHAVAHVEENNIHDNTEDGVAGQDDAVLCVSNNTISDNAQSGIGGSGRCDLTIEDNTLAGNGANVLMRDCSGSISRNNIRGGACGISLYGTSPPISGVDIDDFSSKMEAGIFLSGASPGIWGTTVDIGKYSFGCVCEAGAGPRITSLRFGQGMEKLYRAMGDSHPRLVGHSTDIDRVDILDNSSIIIVDSFQLQVRDSQERPLDHADVLFDGISLTTFPNGSTPWREYDITTMLKGTLHPYSTNTTRDVTVRTGDDELAYEDRAFVDPTQRIFMFDFRPVSEPVPDQYINEDELSFYNLTTFLSDQDNITDDLQLSLCDAGGCKGNVSINNKILELYYARPIDTDIIHLSVTDGLRTSGLNVTVHVIPRNDPPQYIGPTTLVLEEDVPYLFDLGRYLVDEDSELSEFWISVDNKRPEAITWDHLVLNFTYSEGITSDHVVITITGYNRTRCVAVVDITIKPVNDPPLIGEMPVFQFTEGVEETIDLGKYITDPDNAAGELALSQSSRFCTVVNGLRLTFNYTEGVLNESFQITVWDGQNLVSRTLKVAVAPVNVPPAFRALPVFNVIAGKSQTFELWNLIYDPDTPVERIKVRSGSPFVTVNGTNVTIIYPADSPSRTDYMKLVLDDGRESVTYNNIPVNITARSVEQIWTTRYSTYIYILVPFALLAGAVAILAARRYLYGWYDVKRTFLVYQDGRMLAHYGDKADSDDEMLVSSMLTAVQQFIEEAMKKDKAGPIQEFQYKDMKIAVEKGRRLFLAVILKGYTTGGLRRQMKEIVARIEREHEKELREWDGRMTRLPLIEEAVANLKKLGGKGPAS